MISHGDLDLAKKEAMIKEQGYQIKSGLDY